MSKQDKRLQKMASNPRDMRPEELEAALLHAGFARRPGKGDHRIYRRGAQRVTLDYGKSPVLPVYVKLVLEALNAAAAEDALVAAQAAAEEEEEGNE